jgi:Glycosyl hydrolase family 26
MKRAIIIVISTLLPAVLLLMVIHILSNHHAGFAIRMPGSAPAVKHLPSTCKGKQTISKPFFGVAEKNPVVNLHYAQSLTGIKPDVISYYTPFGAPYDEHTICAVGAYSVPLIQWNPRIVTMDGILSGRYDRYLERYAKNLTRYRAPVILSFGHEMNGNWYSWGAGHTDPALFIAAWRHIHDRMKSATNIVWLWNPNRVSGQAQNLSVWYPGSAYVDVIGLDGYYRQQGEVFDRVFGRSLRELHRIAPEKPVILAETGVNKNQQTFAAQFANLLSGVKRWGITGVIWFDVDAKQDWRLNAFRGAEIGKALCSANGYACPPRRR